MPGALPHSSIPLPSRGRSGKDGVLQPCGVAKESPKRVKYLRFSPTLHDWGWTEQQYTIPWSLESHVSPRNINRDKGEMILLPNFRLPTLIHTRSANCKWLYEEERETVV